MQPEDIGQTIAAAILDRRLVPGRRLNELELSRLLGVSRSMIRFALVSLHHDGLVTFEANRGAFVAKPTLAEANFLFEAIAALERSAVDIILAAARAPSLEGLRAVHRKQVKAHAKENMRLSEQLAIDFHREFMALTGNPLLVDAQTQAAAAIPHRDGGVQDRARLLRAGGSPRRTHRAAGERLGSEAAQAGGHPLAAGDPRAHQRAPGCRGPGRGAGASLSR